MSRRLFKYCYGTDARVRIGWPTEGNVWRLLYSGKQRFAYFITSETKRWSLIIDSYPDAQSC